MTKNHSPRRCYKKYFYNRLHIYELYFNGGTRDLRILTRDFYESLLGAAARDLEEDPRYRCLRRIRHTFKLISHPSLQLVRPGAHREIHRREFKVNYRSLLRRST